jgi:Domain of unknown function (DUF4430)
MPMPVDVSIIVENAAPINVPWQPNMNVQTALEAAYNLIQDSTKFSFAIEFFGTYQGPPYGPLGYMVIMLNGTFDLPNQGKYWALLVNGKYATKGIDLTPLSPGDQVQFFNEPYSAQKHVNSAVEHRHKSLQV